MQDGIKDKLDESYSKLLDAKHFIDVAMRETVDIDELMILTSVKQKIPAGADEIKNTLYPPVTKEMKKQMMIEMLKRA